MVTNPAISRRTALTAAGVSGAVLVAGARPAEATPRLPSSKYDFTRP